MRGFNFCVFCFVLNRALPAAVLSRATEVKSLQDYPKGALFEVTAVERVEGEHGEYGVMTCSTTIDGRRECGRVTISKNALQSFVTEPPCLLLYCGTRQGRNGRSFVDVAVTKMADKASVGDIKELADNWRKMSYVTLRAIMQVQPLDNFPVNTMFVYKNARSKLLRKEAREEALLVDVETEVGGESLTGTVAIPRRLQDKIERTPVGVMLWRGLKQMNDGKTYNDVVVFDANSAAAFVNVDD